MYAVSDLMTHDVITVDVSQPLTAVQSLWIERQTSHLPVTENGRLVGILTPLDVVQAFVRGRTGPMVVRDAMTSPVHHVRAGAPLRRAAETMLDKHIGCTVVTDDNDHVVGLLTEADLVRFALDVITDLDRLSDGLRRDAEEAFA